MTTPTQPPQPPDPRSAHAPNAGAVAMRSASGLGSGGAMGSGIPSDRMNFDSPTPLLATPPAQLLTSESQPSSARDKTVSLRRHSLNLGAWLGGGAAAHSAGSPDPLPSNAPTRVGEPQAPPATPIEFVLLDKIGEGGYGEVFEAIQTSLGRIVATKRILEFPNEPPPPGMTAEEAAQESALFFRREALVTANLEHPNIVPIYDFGEDDRGRALLAMKRVRGRPWTDLIREDLAGKSPEDLLARHIPILIDVAQAVAFAHSKGVVHRDIKPGQVMVGEFGEVLLMDWGLAVVYGMGQSMDARSPLAFLARSNDLLTATSPAGTPVFMAPEQTKSKATAIGPWTDVYLLGGTLYALLTGTTPHEAADPRVAFQRAQLGIVDPPELRTPDRHVPQELSHLAMWSLDPQPEKRPASARVFIEELQAYLSGAGKRNESRELVREATTALDRATGNYREFSEVLAQLERALGLWPANPDAPLLQERALSAYVRAALENSDLGLARAQAERIEVESVRTSLLQEVARAERLRRRHNLQRRVALSGLILAAVIVTFLAVVAQQKADQAEMAGKSAVAQAQLADHARARALEEKARAETQEERANSQAAAALHQKESAEYEHYVASLQYAQAAILARRYSIAEQALLRAPVALRRWEWGYLFDQCHRELLTIPGLGAPIVATEFSWDGRSFLSLNRDGVLEVHDLFGSQRLVSLGTVASPVLAALFLPSRDGDLVVFHSGGRLERWRRVDTAPPTYKLASEPLADGLDTVTAATHTPSGHRIAALGANGVLGIWDMTRGVRIASWQLPGAAEDSLSSDTQRGRVVAPPASEQQRMRALGARGLHLDATGAWALAVLPGRPARLYHEGNPAMVGEFGSPEEGTVLAALRSDGRRVVTAGQTGMVRMWDVSTRKEVLRFRTSGSAAETVEFSADGGRVIAAFHDGTAVLWESATAREIARLEGHAGQLVAAQFSPAARRILTLSHDSTARLWDTATGRLLQVLRGHSQEVISSAFTPDGRYVATGSGDGTVRIWPVFQMDGPRRISQHKGGVSHVEFDASSTLAITAGADGSIRVADPNAEILQAQMQPSIGPITRLSHDNTDLHKLATQENLLAVASQRAGVVIVDASDDTLTTYSMPMTPRSPGRVLRAELGGLQWLRAIETSPTLLLTGWSDGAVRAWEPPASFGRLAFRSAILARPFIYFQQPRAVTALSVFQNGGGVVHGATGDDIGSIRLWNGSPQQGVRLLPGHLTSVTGLTWSGNGNFLLSTSTDRTARLWDAESGRELATLRGHLDTVLAAAIFPDGKRILTSGADQTIKVWDPATSRELVTLAGHEGPVASLAVDPSGRRVLSGSSDGYAILWESFPWDLQGFLNETSVASTEQAALAEWQLQRLAHWRRSDPWRLYPRGAGALATLKNATVLERGRVAEQALAALAADLEQFDSPPSEVLDRTATALYQIHRTLPPLPKVHSRDYAMEVLLPVARAAATYGKSRAPAALLLREAHRLAVEQWYVRRLPTHDSAIILHTLGGTLSSLGMADEARAVQRRALAAALLSIPRYADAMDRDVNVAPEAYIEEIHRRGKALGIDVDITPPRDLVFGSNSSRTNWLPGWVSFADWENAGPQGQEEILRRMSKETSEWLDATAPMPDLDRLAARVIARQQLPPKPSPEARLDDILMPVFDLLAADLQRTSPPPTDQ